MEIKVLQLPTGKNPYSYSSSLGIAIRYDDRFLVYLTLTFDFNVLSMICNIRCNLNTISNNCAKYEHPLLKTEREVRCTSHKTELL